MKSRIKQVRQDPKINMSQEAFGARIGVTAAGISKIESGQRNASEQVILSICREFNVNERWLRSGEGAMFIETAEDELRAIARSRGLNDEQYAFLETVMDSPSDDMDAIIRFLQRLAVRMKWISPEGAAPASAPKIPQEMTNAEVLAEVKRQLEDEEKAGATTAVSGLKQSETA